MWRCRVRILKRKTEILKYESVSCCRQFSIVIEIIHIYCIRWSIRAQLLNTRIFSPLTLSLFFGYTRDVRSVARIWISLGVRSAIVATRNVFSMQRHAKNLAQKSAKRPPINRVDFSGLSLFFFSLLPVHAKWYPNNINLRLFVSFHSTLHSAEDWQCNKCANVNWARRHTCNMCNAPKFTDNEERTGERCAENSEKWIYPDIDNFRWKKTGYGGGYNDRGVVEYKERSNDSDDEYDEFGRRKKKREERRRNAQSRCKTKNQLRLSVFPVWWNKEEIIFVSFQK